MIEKVLKLLLLDQDKANHAFYGLLVYSILSLYSPMLALVVVGIQAVGKEIYDLIYKEIHTPDIIDALYTFLPSLIVYSIGVIV